MNMDTGAQILESLRSLGVAVTVIGPNKDRLWLEPADRIPAEMVARIRAAKPEILEALRSRPAEPPTVTYAWPSTPVDKAPFEITKDELKTAPVWLSQHEVVTDVFKFATSTLGQLRRKLETPRAHVGWTVAQLLARLQAVGLTVVVDPEFVKSIPTTNEVQ
jgi:hypothetical protein